MLCYYGIQIAIQMKAKGLALVIILLSMTGCGGNRQSTDDIIVVDVTKSYPLTIYQAII